MSENLRGRSRSRSNHGTHQRHTYVQNQAHASNMSHNNRYSYLNSNVHEHEIVNSSNRSDNTRNTRNRNVNCDKNANSEPKQRIPPIKVTNKKITEIRDAITSMKNVKIVQNMFHPTQYGNYIYAQSVQDYKLIREFCDKNNFKYITHPLSDEIIVRYCLYGLEKMPYDVLAAELAKLNVKPVQITEIPIRNKRYDEHCIYVLHYMRKQKVHLRDLEQITGIFHTRVKFSIYDDPHKFEPKQCKRCQDFNHGERNCTQDFKCRRCAGSHPTKECSYLPEIEIEVDDETTGMQGAKEIRKIKDTKAKIDDKYIKCVNCGNNHTANFKGCSKRQEIIQLRDAIREGRSAPRKSVPNFDDHSQFVPLPKPGRPTGNNSWQESSTSRSYNHQSYHQTTPFTSNNEELFNAEECTNIMKEFMSKLSSCRTKQDQIAIIGELTFKFLWNSP